MSRIICHIHRVIEAVGKHIVAQYIFASSSNNAVCINPPTDLRIVITAGYIVESRLVVVEVATVAEGVEEAGGGGIGDGASVYVCNRKELSVFIVRISVNNSTGIIVEGNNIPLQVFGEIVGTAVDVDACGGTVFIVNVGDIVGRSVYNGFFTHIGSAYDKILRVLCTGFGCS